MVVPQGGYFLWIDLGPGADTTALAARAAEAGVPFVKGADFFADGGGTTCLRLAFSAVPADRIREGIERLGAVIASGRRALTLDQKVRPATSPEAVEASTGVIGRRRGAACTVACAVGVRRRASTSVSATPSRAPNSTITTISVISGTPAENSTKSTLTFFEFLITKPIT